MTSSDAVPDALQPLGTILAGMRRAKKLSGGELGRLVGMSQPKISRLENGVGLPDPDEVGRIARALGADAAATAQLMDMAERSNDRMTDWRPLPDSLAQTQRRVGASEATARSIRMFQPVMVLGLLQTSEYARAVMASLDGLTSPTGGPATSVPAVLEAVSARVRRQEILGDSNRSFEFVMAEAVLSNRICPPEDMPAQIRRLREVAGQDNVSLKIVPVDTVWKVPPVHGFDLLDDDTVTVDLFNTAITSRGKADTRLYRQMFDALAEQATADIGPILDRHLDVYLDLARPGAQP